MQNGRAAVLATGLAAAASVAALPGAHAAPTGATVDTYVFGTVTGRVPKKNSARVAVRWDFKCLGDKLGEATYEWTMVASTLGEEPARKVTLGSGTTKRGSLPATLAPGRWQLRADPFLCETERGAGSTSPEVGQVVTVPDYCAWVVTSARGAVEIEAGNVVRRGRTGLSVPSRATVTTPAAGAVTLTTSGKELTVAAGRSAQLEMRRGACGAGPTMTLASGSLRGAAGGSGAAEIRAGVVRTSGRSARWDVVAAARRVTVSVTAGAVTVRGATGSPVVVRAGFRTIVTGRSAPAAPRRA